MKKIIYFLSIALACICMVSCGGKVTPQPAPTPDPEPEPEKEHVHKLEKVAGQEPTTTAAGWKDYYKCIEEYEACGLFWEDKGGKTLIGDAKALEAWKAEGGKGYLPKKENPEPEPGPGPDPTPEGAGANCYIVAPGATASIPLLRGAGTEALSGVASAEVLWESFNTATAPAKGDVVSSASIATDGKTLSVTAGSKEGNAVVAAKAADGKIVWSWHIWVCNYDPAAKPYVFSAGTMMDRNLGALNNKPADVLSCGLLYQWGRKDPFPGTAKLENDCKQRAATTATWPASVTSSSSKGTIEYATQNPMTFIKFNNQNYDWNYTGNSSNDQTRWTFAKDAKGIYDPCPKGWRVPDGGLDGFWCKVFGVTERNLYVLAPAGANWWEYKVGWFLSFEGADNGGYWFPSAGQFQAANDALKEVGIAGYYANTASGNFINTLMITSQKIESWIGDIDPCINPTENQWAGYSDGQSVRCVKQN